MNDSLDLTFDLDQCAWTCAFLAALGVSTALHGAPKVASTACCAMLDVRDGVAAMAARVASHPICRSLGLGGQSRRLARVTIHDLGILGVESLAAVLEHIDVRDLAMVLPVHEDLFERLEKLVRSRLLSAATLRDLRRGCEGVPPSWRGYREARDRVTRVIRDRVGLGLLPELATVKPC